MKALCTFLAFCTLFGCTPRTRRYIGVCTQPSVGYVIGILTVDPDHPEHVAVQAGDGSTVHFFNAPCSTKPEPLEGAPTPAPAPSMTEQQKI